MTAVSDNFTRANNATLGANWSSQTANPFEILSNAAVNSGGFAVAADYWSANTFGNDQYSIVTITTLVGSNWAGPTVRNQTGGINSNYSFQTNGSSGTGNTYIAKNVGGTQTILLNISTTVSSGAILELDVVGTTLTAKVNGSTVGTITDGTFAAGYPGISGYGGNDVLNTWSGGDFAAATVYTPYTQTQFFVNDVIVQF